VEEIYFEQNTPIITQMNFSIKSVWSNVNQEKVGENHVKKKLPSIYNELDAEG
jgi:hypothetical protein